VGQKGKGKKKKKQVFFGEVGKGSPKRITKKVGKKGGKKGPRGAPLILTDVGRDHEGKGE